MNMGRGKLLLLATVFGLVLSAPAFAGVLYTQPFDGTGNVYASQNDTNGMGLVAQMYDNFTLGSSNTVTEIQFTGGYFNPPNQGPIIGFTVNFYADAAGQPGGLLTSTHVAGTGGETFLGNFPSSVVYTYDISGLSFAAASGTQYWVDVYPDLGFPPQWGWASGTGGDGISYQDFLGVRSQVPADMAFTLIGGTSTIPEPGTLMMLGTGALAAFGAFRRKLGM